MSKLSEAIEARDEALGHRDDAVQELEDLAAAVAADHEDTHTGVFRWCERAACKLVNNDLYCI